MRADHGYFDGSEEVPATRYLVARTGKQREIGLTASAAGYRGVLGGDQVKPQLTDPAVVGTLEIAADGEDVIVRRVRRGCSMVGGHRDARRGSQHPVAVDVIPELVLRSDAGHTAAGLLAAGGCQETSLEELAEILGFGKLEPLDEVHVAGVTVVRSTRPALASDDEIVADLHLVTPVEWDEDLVSAEVPVADMAIDTLVVGERKIPGTKEVASERADPRVTRRAATASRRNHVGLVPSLGEERAERERRPASQGFRGVDVAEDRFADHVQGRETRRVSCGGRRWGPGRHPGRACVCISREVQGARARGHWYGLIRADVGGRIGRAGLCPGACQLLFLFVVTLGRLGRRVKGHPGRVPRCFASRSSSLRAAART